MAKCLFQLGDLDEAIEHGERAVELDEKNADYHFELGLLYAEDARDASIFRVPFVAGKVKEEFEKTNIHDGIDSTLIILNNLMKERITVHKDYGDISNIECLSKLFSNLEIVGCDAKSPSKISFSKGSFLRYCTSLAS